MLLGVLLAFLPAERTADASYCYRGWVTGYVRSEHSSHTFDGTHTADGTPIWTQEPIAAAGWTIPLGSYVEVEGLGRYRVADRGMLGPDNIDIAVWDRATAFEMTGMRSYCVYPPG